MAARKRWTRSKRTSNSEFRSNLEEKVVGDLVNRGVVAEYEPMRIEYLGKPHHYVPDLSLPNGIIIEIKGWFQSKDRAKHLLVKQQHPEFDIRFVFSAPNNKISKQSNTTYAMWCERHGFEWATGTVPQAWIDEQQTNTTD